MDWWLPTLFQIVALIVSDLRSDKSLSHFTFTMPGISLHPVSGSTLEVRGPVEPREGESLTRVIKSKSSFGYFFSLSFCTESFTNGCYSLVFNEERTSIRSLAFHRAFSSFTKHLLTKSTKSRDHLDEGSAGGSLFRMWSITSRGDV